MEKKVTPKNYLKWFMTLIVIVLAVFLLSKVYTKYIANNVNKNPLEKIAIKANLDSIKEKLDSTTGNKYVFITYTGTKDIYNTGKSLAKFIKKNKLKSDFYVIDVTDYLENEGLIENINNALNLKNPQKIEKVPAMILYSNGEVAKVMDSEIKEFNLDDFKHLLDSFEIKWVN